MCLPGAVLGDRGRTLPKKQLLSRGLKVEHRRLVYIYI